MSYVDVGCTLSNPGFNFVSLSPSPTEDFRREMSRQPVSVSSNVEVCCVGKEKKTFFFFVIVSGKSFWLLFSLSSVWQTLDFSVTFSPSW